MRPTIGRPGLLSSLQKLFGVKDPHHGFAGHDLQGNRYYERQVEGIDRIKRSVEYAGEDFRHWDVTARQNALPIQWQAWMRHSRKDPPTLQELEADQTRQSTLRQRVQVLEAKDREEQLRQRAAAAAATIKPPTAPTASLPEPAQQVKAEEVAPTPESDPLRQESQRALQEEDAKRKAADKTGNSRGTGPESVRNPLKSGEGIGGEWKPEGWAPAVGKRRGKGSAAGK